MKYVHRMCYEEVNEDCSRMAHKQFNLKYEDTEECVKMSFEGSNFQKDENTLLKAEAEEWKAYGSAFWPALVINNRTYRGDLISDNVATAICSSFTSPPYYCETVFSNEPIVGEPLVARNGVTKNVLISVVVFLVLVNILLLFLYRRCANREVKDQMQMQVNSAVS